MAYLLNCIRQSSTLQTILLERKALRKLFATEIIASGDPHNCVDIAFIAEGYTASEMAKFRADVARLSKELLSEAPFRSYKKNINVWAVESVSDESGTDVPGEDIYVNTAVNSSFYTFSIDRYLTSLDLKSNK